MNQTDIINAMLQILREHGKRSLGTFNFQLPDDGTIGAVVRWISEDAKEYKSIREAANRAGLWFAYTRRLQRYPNGSEELSVLVVENNNTR